MLSQPFSKVMKALCCLLVETLIAWQYQILTSYRYGIGQTHCIVLHTRLLPKHYFPSKNSKFFKKSATLPRILDFDRCQNKKQRLYLYCSVLGGLGLNIKIYCSKLNGEILLVVHREYNNYIIGIFKVTKFLHRSN